MSPMQKMMSLMQSTNAARERCKDRSIGTNVKAGMFRVVRVRYHASGKSVVEPVTSPMTFDQTIQFLDAM